jgi:hypothetical protein
MINNTNYGLGSLENNSGNNNTGIGAYAGYNNLDASNNTAVGSNSAFFNTIGSNNTSMGAGSLCNNTTGSLNTAIGSSALEGVTGPVGNQNTAVGVQSLYTNQGNQNTAIGAYSALGVTGGNYNTFLGTNSSTLNDENYDYSTAIGYNSKIDSSNQIMMGGTGPSGYPDVIIPGNAYLPNFTTATSSTQIVTKAYVDSQISSGGANPGQGLNETTVGMDRYFNVDSSLNFINYLDSTSGVTGASGTLSLGAYSTNTIIGSAGGNPVQFLSDISGNVLRGDLVPRSGSSQIFVSNTNLDENFFPVFVSGVDQTATWIDITTGSFTYNPSTGTLTATTFSGTATNANITDTDASGVFYPTFVDGSGNRPLNVDITTSPLTYVPSTGTLTATTFSGTATNATNANITNTDASGVFYPTFVDGSGNRALNVDITTSPLTYVPFTGTLTSQRLNVISDISSNSVTITPTNPSAVNPTAGITNTWNSGGFLAFADASGTTVNTPGNLFCADTKVRIDNWGNTPAGSISLFEINFTFNNTTNWGQTCCYLQLYPTRFWPTSLGIDNKWAIDNKINGNNSYSITDATYAPNGRWYWTYQQNFSGIGSENAWLVPGNGYVDIYFRLPDNTYSYECYIKCLDASTMVSAGQSWELRKLSV